MKKIHFIIIGGVSLALISLIFFNFSNSKVKLFSVKINSSFPVIPNSKIIDFNKCVEMQNNWPKYVGGHILVYLSTTTSRTIINRDFKALGFDIDFAADTSTSKSGTFWNPTWKNENYDNNIYIKRIELAKKIRLEEPSVNYADVKEGNGIANGYLTVEFKEPIKITSFETALIKYDLSPITIDKIDDENFLEYYMKSLPVSEGSETKWVCYFGIVRPDLVGHAFTDSITESF